MTQRLRAVTLLELLISIVLVSIIIMGLSNIEIFSRHQVTTADRRAKMQNQVSYVLEHMNKTMLRAIGNTGNWAVQEIPGTTLSGFRVRIDDGADSIGVAADDDTWVAYIHRNKSGTGKEADSTIEYCRNAANLNDCEILAHKMVKNTVVTNCCVDSPGWCGNPGQPDNSANNCEGAGSNVGLNLVGNFVTGADATQGRWLEDSILTVKIVGRWFVDDKVTPDNPEISMRNSMSMPAVSTR